MALLLTGRRYADEHTSTSCHPFTLEPLEIPFVFQDDNARPHRARLVENMLEAETILAYGNCQRALSDLNQSSMFGTYSDDALLRDRATCYCRDLEVHFLRGVEQYSPKV
ncbi:hypothetical protein TNCV_2657581 [Trichonephila clavipes]|nr:hypothetical protein TNCV_2657581 [Trichonephila clavipes]